MAGDHIGIVEGVDEAEAQLPLQTAGFGAGGVVVVAIEHHLGAAGCHRPHLHLRRGDRHHDHGTTAQPLGGQGHPLGVVAGAGGDHATVELGAAEAHHPVVGAAQLEAEHRLQILPLEQHPVAQAGREVGGRIEGGFDGHVVDAGPQDPLQVGSGLRWCGRSGGLGGPRGSVGLAGLIEGAGGSIHGSSLAIDRSNGHGCRHLPVGKPYIGSEGSQKACNSAR